MKYRIIDAEASHIPQLEAIERECFSCPWTADQLLRALRGEGHEFLIAAEDDGRVLGYAGMSYVLDEGYVSNVAVSSVYRRMGVGERLLGALKVRAAELDLSFISLEVREGNAPARGLYSKLGFEPVGLRKGYYEKPREDAVLMTYFLNRGKDSEDTCI